MATFNTEAPRGSGYDMMPWKLVACPDAWTDCPRVAKGRPSIRLSDLPTPNTPGRIPRSADHLHVTEKFSGDRNASDLRTWRALLYGTLRCDHGRLTGASCRQCPGRTAAGRTGERIGTHANGTPIVVPDPRDREDPNAWLALDLQPRGDRRAAEQ